MMMRPLYKIHLSECLCVCVKVLKTMTTATPTSQVMKVKRENLAACLTCPLCDEFFRDATTISECLHSYESPPPYYVEAASRTKPSKSSKPAVPDAQPRAYQSRKKKAALSEGLSVQSHAIVYSESGERCSPIWFSLVASEDQKGDAPLQQIPSSYLRAKDGSLPVSFIKKYIAKKLNLLSYAEVEISLWGQPLLSTLQLHSVVNLYAQTFSSPERIRTTTGSSARDFVMVLAYGRRAAAQPRPLQAYYTDA